MVSTSRAIRRERRDVGGRLLLLAMFTLGLLAALAAAATAHDVTGERTVVVRVAAGGSLWEIAAAHRSSGKSTAETVDTIRRLNRLSGSELETGQTLIVPAVPLQDPTTP